MNIKSITVVGGDKRMIFAGEALQKHGYDVSYSYMENYTDMSLPAGTDFSADAFILPLPPIKSGAFLNAPFSDKAIPVDDEFAKKIKGKPVFCAMAGKLKSIGNLHLIEYYDRQDVIVKNADLTAKALILLMNEKKLCISAKKALVVGWGRVGKACARILRDNGCEVCVSARRRGDLAEIELQKYRSTLTTEPENTEIYDMIINTVPALVINKEIISKMKKNAVIIDLASNSGGTDFAFASESGIKAIHALGLPGKYLPKESGELIKDTILSIIKEDAL